jgi:plasmid stabilization system protein ParE
MHQVLLTQRAQDELDQAHDWWAENRSSEQANRWYVEFLQAMLTLENAPQRWPLAPENEFFPYEVRQLNFGLGSRPTHRALYTVRPDVVVILRVRHLAQEPLSADDI